jgi:branched-chain amino acid aminotransferase
MRVSLLSLSVLASQRLSVFFPSERHVSKVYLNGRFVDEKEAVVSAADRGFLYGDGLFETMRAYSGRVFRLGEHLRRLSSSARVLRIPLKTAPAGLEAAVERLLAVNRLRDAYVRITLSRGRHTGDLGLDTGGPPTLVMSARAYHGYPAELYARGMRLTVAESVRDTKSSVGRHKTLNYLENLLERDAAKSRGFDEVLFLDEKGRFVECATANVFFVRDGDLSTPSAEMNLLCGITRAVVMELARARAIKIIEGKWRLEKLQRADEAFLTNSLMEIMPVREVAGVSIGGTVPGDVTRSLAADYRRLVEKECSGA